MILEVFCSGPVQTNCTILACSKTLKGAIIDAPAGCIETVLKRIRDLNLHMEMLLFTHSHWDHTAEAAELKKRLGLSLYVHERDLPNLRSPGADGLPLLFPIEKAEADHLLKGGEIINLGELEIEVIHTPGHSPGSVCFYLPKEGVLISGDTLFHGTIGNLSFPTSEPNRMWGSLEKLAHLPPETRVVPGHGEETTIGREKWLKNPKDYFGG